MKLLRTLAWTAAVIIGGTFAFLLWLASLVVDVRAHSFYPADCCSGTDCAPIAEARVRPAFAGYMIDGVHYVPMAQVKPSPDGEYHACFPKPETLRCFWAPPQGS